MNKKAFINEILEIFDENEELKRKLKEYETPKDTEQPQSLVEQTSKDKVFNDLDNKAKELLFDEVIRDWTINGYNPVEVKEDGGSINFLTFPQWFKALNIYDVIDSDYKKILNTLSGYDLKKYFEKQFENWFNKKVNDKRMEIVRSKKDETI